MSMKLAGQTAVIVGGARGIGAAIAERFAGEGANIVLVDLAKMKSEGEQLASKIVKSGGKACVIPADCTDSRQVELMVKETLGTFGRIDILVNSAGLRGPLVPVQDITEEEYDVVQAVNLKAAFLGCKAV